MPANVLYIHGAYSSPVTFATLIRRLPEHRSEFARYDCLQNSIAEVVEMLAGEAEQAFRGEPYRVVGHSLGGVIAVLLYGSGQPVERIFTMASPFGGSRMAQILQVLFYQSRIYRDITPLSQTILQVLDTKIAIPMVSVVTTSGGTPLFPHANDGVVTVASQLSLSGPAYHAMPYNHFEVLLADPVVDLLHGTLF